MAATDEYENQLPIQNTGKHIRALDANGNPILIPIDEMAKVVGGLIGTATPEKNGLLSSGVYKKIVFNGDEIKSLETSKTGIYQYNLSGNNTYAPIPEWPWGTVAIFGGNWGIIQFATSTLTDSNHIYARKGRVNSGGVLEFTKWSTII